MYESLMIISVRVPISAEYNTFVYEVAKKANEDQEKSGRYSAADVSSARDATRDTRFTRRAQRLHEGDDAILNHVRNAQQIVHQSLVIRFADSDQYTCKKWRQRAQLLRNSFHNP